MKKENSALTKVFPVLEQQRSEYAIPGVITVTSANRLVAGSVLGKGAFGIVYSLQPTEKNVVKLVSVDVGKTLFNKEIDMLSKATISQAGHVVSLEGLIRQNSQIDMREEKFQNSHLYALVLERMDMGSLYDLLQSGQPMPWDLRLQITIDVAMGLVELHRLGIIHGDIKSLNVLLNKSAEAKIGDLGAAILTTEADKVDVSCIGTTRWMSPEQKQENDSSISQKSDTYSFGLVIRELITREIPQAVNEKGNPNLSKPEIKGLGEQEEIIFEALWKASLACQETDPQKRPSLEEVISSLEQAYAEAYKKKYAHEINKLEYVSPSTPINTASVGGPISGNTEAVIIQEVGSLMTAPGYVPPLASEGAGQPDIILDLGSLMTAPGHVPPLASEGAGQPDIILDLGSLMTAPGHVPPLASEGTGQSDIYIQAPQGAYDVPEKQESIAKQEEGGSFISFGRLCGLLGLLAARPCPVKGKEEEKPMPSSGNQYGT